jgi:hypothetical protein
VLNKLVLTMVAIIALTGCAGKEVSSPPSPESSEPSIVEVISQVEDLLLSKEEFPVEPTTQSSGGLDNFNLFFSGTLEDNNACSESNSLQEQVSKLNLLTSRESGYDEEFAFFGQWVFDAESASEAETLYSSFTRDYLDERCADTLPLGFFEEISQTDSLPVGFKGNSWVVIMQIDPDLAISRSISTNGRYLMLGASMAPVEGDYRFTGADSSKSLGLAMRAFTDSKLPD